MVIRLAVFEQICIDQLTISDMDVSFQKEPMFDICDGLISIEKSC